MNVALLVKDEDGKTSFKETEDVGAGKGALFVAFARGFVARLAVDVVSFFAMMELQRRRVAMMRIIIY